MWYLSKLELFFEVDFLYIVIVQITYFIKFLISFFSEISLHASDNTNSDSPEIK